MNKQEIDFCELFIFGCDPYAGNARKCYEDIFYDSSHTSLRKLIPLGRSHRFGVGIILNIIVHIGQ